MENCSKPKVKDFIVCFTCLFSVIVYFDLNRKFSSHFLIKFITGYFVFIPAILGYFLLHALLCVLFNSVTLEAMLLFFYCLIVNWIQAIHSIVSYVVWLYNSICTFTCEKLIKSFL